MKRTLHSLLAPAALLLWSLAALYGMTNEHLLPAPWRLLSYCWGFVTGQGWVHPYAGQFLRHASASLVRVLSGFLIAAAVGIPAGVLHARRPLFSGTVDPLLQIIRSVPGIAWLPVAMLWFGIGTTTTVFLIALAAFFPIYINTAQGIMAVPPAWLNVARTLGARRRVLLLGVILPGAWPSIRSGLRLAMGLAWAYVVLGELTGVNNGLGAMLMDARMMGDSSAIYVGMIHIAVLGRICDLLLTYVTGRLWRRDK